MKHWSDSPRQGAVVTVPLVWVALFLSLILHIAVMWVWLPRMRLVSANPDDLTQSGGPLAVHLATQPTETKVAAAPPTPPAVAQPPPPPSVRAPSIALRAPPKPPAPIASAPIVPIPNPAAPPPPPPPVPTPAPKATPAPPIPADMDLSAYLAAKRRARGETESTASQPATESDTARRDRIVAANLAAVRTPNLGNDQRNGGGLFEIRRLGADDAEFMFFGWNKEIKRRVPQMIEVKRGTNGTIQIALVRKMIGIIRDYEEGDFAWESRRLGRVLTLSARASDNGELEAFMMKEFFDTIGAPR